MKKCVLSVMILALLAALSGCAAAGQPETQPETTAASTEVIETEPERRLKISVVGNDEPGMTSEDVGEDSDLELSYGKLSQVDVELDGTVLPLTQAIREKKITILEILAYAQIDAENGICQESHVSEKGVTQYIYVYPEYGLHLTRDVYETPDGKQHMIEGIYIHKKLKLNTVFHNVGNIYIDEDSPTGDFLDREDWGLTFEVAELSETGLTLTCTQQGGQQIGQLEIYQYRLFVSDDPYWMTRNSEYQLTRSDKEMTPISLPADGTAQITLNLPESILPLEPGDYYVVLYVEDIYDESQVHPLMVNYADNQSYHVRFTVE